MTLDSMRFQQDTNIRAYTHYLLMKGQLAGNMKFYEHEVSTDELDIARECRDWAERIGRKLTSCKESEMPDLLEYYDLVYRVGYKKLPDADFILRCKNRVFKAWKNQKHLIEESRIIGMIATEVKYYPESTGIGWATAYGVIMQKWVDTLIKHNTFPDATSYEKYQRLAIIMRENIKGYLHDNDDDDFCYIDPKQKWYEKNKVENISALPSLILRSYRSFISSIPSDIIDFDESMNIDTLILQELSTRSDLDPYDREAFRLALQAKTEEELV